MPVLKRDYQNIVGQKHRPAKLLSPSIQESHYFQFLSNISGEDYGIAYNYLKSFKAEVDNDFKDLRGVLQCFGLKNINEIVEKYKHEKMMEIAL